MEKLFHLNHKIELDKHSIILVLIISISIFILIMMFGVYITIHQDANDLSPDSLSIIEIPKGTNFRGTIKILDENKIIEDRWKLLLTAKLLGKTKSIQAGKFYIKGGINYYDLIILLENAVILQQKITIPEGLELTEIAQIFEDRLNIPVDTFLLYRDDTELFNINYKSIKNIEGFLFPDTYFFFEDAEVEEVIRKMIFNFQKHITVNMIWKAKEKGMTVNELITMASIIQGEVIYDSEMPKVASVYFNRLKKNMRLQADPTIQYIIPGPDRLLKLSELKSDSEYNTYMHRGLPPGPINNPGLEAIRATINPDTTDYIYFVADGNGYHTFTKTLSEHNYEKNKLKILRRKKELENKVKTKIDSQSTK